MNRHLLHALGRWRSFWWGVVRSEESQRQRFLLEELTWSGKILQPDDLDELIDEQRPEWRRRR